MSNARPGHSGHHALRAPLAVALYAIAFALLAEGVARSLVVGGIAAPFGSIRWRFGFLGVLFISMIYPLLGMAVGSLAAAVFRHRGMLLIFGGLQAIVTLGMVGSILIFLLDAAQIAATVPEPMRGGYGITVAQTSVNGVLAVVLFGALTWATFAAYRAERATRVRPAASAAGIVIGR